LEIGENEGEDIGCLSGAIESWDNIPRSLNCQRPGAARLIEFADSVSRRVTLGWEADGLRLDVRNRRNKSLRFVGDWVIRAEADARVFGHLFGRHTRGPGLAAQAASLQLQPGPGETAGLRVTLLAADGRVVLGPVLQALAPR
jgi:hypothetical protein